MVAVMGISLAMMKDGSGEGDGLVIDGDLMVGQLGDRDDEAGRGNGSGDIG